MSSITVYVYLETESGASAGATHMLEPESPARIGRAIDCFVVLNDPLASRVHAIITYRADGWWIRDLDSRNGTYVDGSRVEEALLADGTQVQIGSTRMRFRISTSAPADTDWQDKPITQQIKRRTQIQPTEMDHAVQAVLRQPERADDVYALYQLGLRLLEEDRPPELIRTTLEALVERTGASVAGFLWLSEDGQLKPRVVIPDDAGAKLRLSEFLTDLVTRKQQAAWVANSLARPAESDSLADYADAICVPLVQEAQVIGVLHLYREQRHFRNSDYDFALAVAGILATGLGRARRQMVLRANHERLVAKNAAFDELVGESSPMKSLKGKIARVARATGCVLVRGESGSGKELVAQAIHQAGPRSDCPLLTVNCAAIPRELMESQLFGHRRGAFTGADSDHRGWFQQADTGTLFLDEVGELTLEGQAKLLRILEGHPFTPVGSSEEISVDVRVIAATNRDLREFVQQKQFREDLYYRLTVFELVVPPLRERGGDIDLLVDHFLDHFRIQHGRPRLELSHEARQRLQSYSWPGNVRQLRNVIDSAVVLAEGPCIEAADLGLNAPLESEPDTLRIDEWERRLVRRALERTNGRVPEAARLLGISRATLYRKIDEYGLREP